MRIYVNILSALAIVPLVTVLAYFGLIGLLGALPMTVNCWGMAVCICISSFYFRPNEYGSLLGAGQAIHLALVGLGLWLVVAIIESPNTDTGHYRPIYYGFVGLPILLIAPILHRLITRKEAEHIKRSVENS